MVNGPGDRPLTGGSGTKLAFGAPPGPARPSPSVSPASADGSEASFARGDMHDTITDAFVPNGTGGSQATDMLPSQVPTQANEIMHAHTPKPMDISVSPGVMLSGRYVIQRKLGEGGMGTVWEARHAVIGKLMAVKVLYVDSEHEGSTQQAERFMREARLASKIRHEHIVDITDFGHTPTGAPYYVMELLEGETLETTLGRAGPLPWERVRNVMLQLSDALHCAHMAGVVHRDLKPDNVFLLRNRGRGDVCKVIDFGIAKLMELDYEAEAFTRTGMVFGTPSFMSPEQARGERVDARTDIYALGCMMYQMLTGHKPFEASTATAILFKQLFEEPVPPCTLLPAASIPSDAEAIVLRAMRKDPALRFSSMAALRDAVLAVGTGAPAVMVPKETLPTPPRAVLTHFSDLRAAGALANGDAGASFPSRTERLPGIPANRAITSTMGTASSDAPSAPNTFVGTARSSTPPFGSLLAMTPVAVQASGSSRMVSVVFASIVLAGSLLGAGLVVYRRIVTQSPLPVAAPATAAPLPRENNTSQPFDGSLEAPRIAAPPTPNTEVPQPSRTDTHGETLEPERGSLEQPLQSRSRSRGREKSNVDEQQPVPSSLALEPQPEQSLTPPPSETTTTPENAVPPPTKPRKRDPNDLIDPFSPPSPP